jgi:hypothetical protein
MSDLSAPICRQPIPRHRTIDHRVRLWDPRCEIATRSSAIFSKKLEASPPADVPPSRRAPSDRA